MRRREFLGKTIIGTAGIALGGSALLNSCKGANDKIVLALIGAGGRGVPTIISCCSSNTNVEIKTVCDVNDERSAAAVSEIEKKLGYKPQAKRYMKEVFDDSDIDAVWIATPDHWHALATIWACQSGKDVYVEKTPGLCIAEGRKMADAAKKYRQIVQAGFQNRSGAYIAAARDYIQSGKLGQVVHIRIFNLLTGTKWIAAADSEIPAGLEWNEWLGPAPLRKFNAGILNGWYNYYDYNPGTLNDASHQLDITRMLMGDPGHPRSVYGWGGKNIFHSERESPESQSITYDFDKFTVTVDSGNGTNYMSKTPQDIRMDPTRFPEWKTNADRIEIYGTLGMMYMGRTGGGWQVYGPGEQKIAEGGGIHPDKEHQINFIESIRNRKQPNASMEQAHLSASLVHFANIAYRTGNKQLLFDGQKEIFIDNDEANKLLKVSYRDNYIVPEKI
ncbi:MAG: Gfo/Idh/MocA family oxidoreductase [Bacteroidales bacterium]|nr:Gfo/Idh/MocA family oxidoreductase [Bacteroidales bacterium]